MRKKKVMLGQRVLCRVRSAYETKSVVGTLVRRCDNENVYVLKLEHGVDFHNVTDYTYPKHSTILVTSSEIL